MLEHLKPLAALHWSPAANFHITTKFIGSWSAERLDELKAALQTVPKRGPIRVGIGGFGWFPNPHVPRTLFAGVRAPQELFDVAKDLDAVLKGLGIEPEARDYLPHLTLAKMKAGTDVSALRRAIAELPSAEFGASTAAKVLLYKSEAGEESSVYTVIGEIAL